MTTIIYLDAETSIKNRGVGAIGNNKAAPWHPDNKIVMLGMAVGSDSVDVCTDSRYNLQDSIDMLVGHNIKFDLHYIMNSSEESREWIATGRIWDTQLAEYILTGQNHKYPSLDECSLKYGGTVKDDRIKEYWKAGVDTEDIPKDQLQDYLEWDVKNTRTIFEAQFRKAEELGMLPLIMSQMDALLGTIEMEFNGMVFDKDTAKELSADAREELHRIENLISDCISDITDDEFESNINPYSPDQLSMLLFGGEYKYQIDAPVLDEDGNPIKYKTGKRIGEVKTRKEFVTKHTKGMGIVPEEDWKGARGIYKTNDEVLTVLKNKGFATAEAILNMRELKKDVGTYYDGYSDLVWPDGCIHGSLNHVSTGTGRLSSTQPNLQNVTSASED